MNNVYQEGQVLKVIDHTGCPIPYEVVSIAEPSAEERETFMQDSEYKVVYIDGAVAYWDLEGAVEQGKVTIEVLL